MPAAFFLSLTAFPPKCSYYWGSVWEPGFWWRRTSSLKIYHQLKYVFMQLKKTWQNKQPLPPNLHFVCILYLHRSHIQVFHRQYQYSGKLSLVVCRPSQCWQMHYYTEMQKLYLYFCMYPAKTRNIQNSPCYSVTARSSQLLGFPAAFGLISHVHMYFRLLNFIMQSIMHCSSNKWEVHPGP